MHPAGGRADQGGAGRPPGQHSHDGDHYGGADGNDQQRSRQLPGDHPVAVQQVHQHDARAYQDKSDQGPGQLALLQGPAAGVEGEAVAVCTSIFPLQADEVDLGGFQPKAQAKRSCGATGAATVREDGLHPRGEVFIQ